MKPMVDDDEDDMAAISGVMAAETPEMEGAEPKPAGDPETLVSEIKAKLAELEETLSQL